MAMNSDDHARLWRLLASSLIWLDGTVAELALREPDVEGTLMYALSNVRRTEMMSQITEIADLSCAIDRVDLTAMVRRILEVRAVNCMLYRVVGVV